MRLLNAIALIALSLPQVGQTQSIQINGQTATSVGTRPGGGLAITIAPPDAKGVSKNGFKRFNVDTAGASFDNNGVGASTIVSEISGIERTTIRGALNVDGDRADVILVNPNGITINGGQFNNMRGLALIAGRSRVGSTDLVYDLSGADIDVGTSGLTANIRRLDLVARTLRVEGAITEDSTFPFVTIGLAAGPGSVKIDPSVFSIDDPEYLKLLDRGATQDGVSLTISQGANLSGGSVTMVADGRGAGVRMAGDALASVGQFRLSANGSVDMLNSTVSAQSDVVVEGAEVSSKGGRIVTLAGTLDIRSTTSGISLDGTEFQSILATNFDAQTDLSFANLTGRSDDGLNFASGGEITVNAAGLSALSTIDIRSAGLTLASSEGARAIIESTSGDLQFDVSGAVRSEGGLLQGGTVKGRMGALFLKTSKDTEIASLVGNTGAIDLAIDEDVESQSGRILAFSDLTLTAGGNLLNKVAKTESGVRRSGFGSALIGDRKTTYDAGTYLAGTEISQILSGGALRLSAGGDLENIGGQISGGSIRLSGNVVTNQLEQFGSVTTRKKCLLFFCRAAFSGGYSFDGGTIDTAGQLEIAATRGFVNVGGVVRGDASVSFSGPSVSFQPLKYSDFYERPAGLGGLVGGKKVRAFISYEGGVLLSSLGGLSYDEDAAVTFDGTTIEPEGLVDPKDVDLLVARPAGLTELNRTPLGLFSFILD